MSVQTRPDPSIPIWAETGDIDPNVTPSIVSVGWPYSSVPPSRKRFNWLQNFLFKSVRYILQFGVSEYSSGETYNIGAKVQVGGLLYSSLANNNTGNTPSSSPNFWERWGWSESQIDARVDRLSPVSVAGGTDVTLSSAQYLNGIILLTGVLTANINVILPNTNRRYVIKNGTTGAYTLTLKCPLAGTTLGVVQGQSVVAYTDGANNVAAAGSSGQTLVATTNNGVTYVNSSGSQTSGANFTFDGTNATVSGTVTAGAFSGAGTGLTGTANSLNAGLGVNQTWQDVTASRVSGTNYTNSSGKTRFLSIRSGNNGTGGTISLTVDGLVIYSDYNYDPGSAGRSTITEPIPNGSVYSVSGVVSAWYELG